MPEINLTKKQAITLVVSIMILAFFLKLVIAVAYQNYYDTFWYKQWAQDLPNGFFNIYSRADSISLDYPPLYLYPLLLIGYIYKWIPGISGYMPYQMFFLKLFPIIFDTLCIYVLYLALRKYSQSAGVLAAFLWAVNPSAIFNSSFWGQTDTVMIFLLIVSFALISDKRYISGSVIFALAGLTKYQALFFLPVLLLELFFKGGIKKALQSIVAAAGTVLFVFLPFMIGSKNILLPFKIYFGTTKRYPYDTLNAFNLYGVLNLNGVRETFTFEILNFVFLTVTIAFIIFMYVKGKHITPWLTGFLLMQSIFMLTLRMHERYQIAVLPFVLMVYLISKRKQFLYLFTSLSVLTLINQAVSLFSLSSDDLVGFTFPKGNLWTSPWTDSYGGIMLIFSIINYSVYIWSLIVCISYSFRKERQEILLDEESTNT